MLGCIIVEGHHIFMDDLIKVGSKRLAKEEQ
jgi:hypothetical protein